MGVLYHTTTPHKAKKYHETGCIFKPVRGFTTLQAAMAWAIKANRSVIYEVNYPDGYGYKLPDHHNKFGDAWWVDKDMPLDRIKCVFSADKDA